MPIEVYFVVEDRVNAKLLCVISHDVVKLEAVLATLLSLPFDATPESTMLSIFFGKNSVEETTGLNFCCPGVGKLACPGRVSLCNPPYLEFINGISFLSCFCLNISDLVVLLESLGTLFFIFGILVCWLKEGSAKNYGR